MRTAVMDTGLRRYDARADCDLVADIHRTAGLSAMNILSRIISWIDAGYGDGIARSNYVMGLALAIIGLVALNVESATARMSFAVLAVAIVMVFAWRMAVWVRCLAKRANQKRRRGI